jgi:hypothetical protein
MAYASSIHINLYQLRLNIFFRILSNSFPSIIMSTSASKFSKDAILFEISIWYCSWTYIVFNFLRLNFCIWYLCNVCLLTYQPLPNFWNHRIVIHITICCLNDQTSSILEMLLPIFQNMVNPILSLSIMDVQVNLWMLWCSHVTTSVV